VKHLSQIVPDVATLLALETPELAGVVLEQLTSLRGGEESMFHLGNFTNDHSTSHFSSFPVEHRKTISYRLAEAWSWLIAHGLIAPRPHDGENGWVFVTELGKRTRDAGGLREYRKALYLPKERLHPSIANRCFGHFLRGLFDTAVFEAYKALEITIRDAAKLPQSLLGVSLARKAFAPQDGPLTVC